MTWNLNLHPAGEYISDYIRQWGCWKPITSEVLLEVLKAEPQAIFVDVGANIGYFSLLAAEQGSRVFAIEPVVENFQLLQKTVLENNLEEQIIIAMVPLWEKEERITLIISNKNMGLASTRKSQDFSYAQTCTAYPFDKFFGPKTTYKLVIKIDVEHAELQVLRGMKGSMHAITHILMELSLHDTEVFDILEEHGFLYAAEIGYDTAEKVVRADTSHLKDPKHLSTLAHMRDEMPKRARMMILFYKTPNPV